jgi:hypothetical protein
VVDSLIAEVVVKNKKVVVILTPPLSGLGFLSTPLAPRGGIPQTGQPFVIRIVYSLMPYYGGTNGMRAVIGLGCQKSTAPGIGTGNG